MMPSSAPCCAACLSLVAQTLLGGVYRDLVDMFNFQCALNGSNSKLWVPPPPSTQVPPPSLARSLARSLPRALAPATPPLGSASRPLQVNRMSGIGFGAVVAQLDVIDNEHLRGSDVDLIAQMARGEARWGRNGGASGV